MLSKPVENPFVKQLALSPYVRFVENNWIENNWAFAMLIEVIRSTPRAEEDSSESFHFGKLKPGKGTELAVRPLSQA